MVNPLNNGVRALACRIILKRTNALKAGLHRWSHGDLSLREALKYTGPAFYPEEGEEDMRVIVDEAGCTVHIMSDNPYRSVLYHYPAHIVLRVAVDEA